MKFENKKELVASSIVFTLISFDLILAIMALDVGVWDHRVAYLYFNFGISQLLYGICMLISALFAKRFLQPVVLITIVTSVVYDMMYHFPVFEMFTTFDGKVIFKKDVMEYSVAYFMIVTIFIGLSTGCKKKINTRQQNSKSVISQIIYLTILKIIFSYITLLTLLVFAFG